MGYYLCWHKVDGREWLVKARNADEARQKLLEAGEISEEEAKGGERVTVRCYATGCRQYNACGSSVTRITTP